MTEKSKIIPFGKYKGQPIEVLSNDPQYREWLSGQDWFREKFSNLYQTVIVNNFSEPTETPEHNKLQVLFLDDEFCVKFVETIYPGFFDVVDVEKTIFESAQWAKKIINDTGWGADEKYELKKYLENLPLPSQLKINKVINCRFEERGIDVILNYGLRIIGLCYFETLIKNGIFRIEIKPSIGDDYPGVLRQMRTNHSNVLFVGNYCGSGATKDQFIRTFQISEIKVIFREDVK